MGIRTEVRLLKRGYYPTGGGEATVTLYPIETLKSFSVQEPPNFTEISGIIHRANLPDHISTRMKHAVMKIMMKHNLRTSIQVEAASSSSTGTGITLWSTSDQTILGSTVLGEKSLSAETVGETAANHLMQEITCGATIDRYAIDQILPYLVLVPKESSCLIREISNHTQTNMWLIKRFFSVDFEVTSQQDTHRIIIR